VTYSSSFANTHSTTPGGETRKEKDATLQLEREKRRERERTDTMDKEEQKCIDMPRRDERRRKQKNAG
jgi:hypothetical protein